MRWYVIGGFFLLAAIGTYFNLAALNSLASEAEETLRKVRRWGPLARRELFTETGWKYRKLAWLFFGLSFVYLLAGSLLAT